MAYVRYKSVGLLLLFIFCFRKKKIIRNKLSIPDISKTLYNRVLKPLINEDVSCPESPLVRISMFNIIAL